MRLALASTALRATSPRIPVWEGGSLGLPLHHHRRLDKSLVSSKGRAALQDVGSMDAADILGAAPRSEFKARVRLSHQPQDINVAKLKGLNRCCVRLLPHVYSSEDA